MDWKELTDESQLIGLNEESHKQPVVIFKHSTRCSISRMAKARLEREDIPEKVPFYYLDLFKYRTLSHQVTLMYGVKHESPQVLLIRGGVCIYHASHGAVAMDELIEHI